MIVQRHMYELHNPLGSVVQIERSNRKCQLLCCNSESLTSNLYLPGSSQPTLIVCPLSVISNWEVRFLARVSVWCCERQQLVLNNCVQAVLHVCGYIFYSVPTGQFVVQSRWICSVSFILGFFYSFRSGTSDLQRPLLFARATGHTDTLQWVLHWWRVNGSAHQRRARGLTGRSCRFSSLR